MLMIRMLICAMALTSAATLTIGTALAQPIDFEDAASSVEAGDDSKLAAFCYLYSDASQGARGQFSRTFQEQCRGPRAALRVNLFQSLCRMIEIQRARFPVTQRVLILENATQPDIAELRSALDTLREVCRGDLHAVASIRTAELDLAVTRIAVDVETALPELDRIDEDHRFQLIADLAEAARSRLLEDCDGNPTVEAYGVLFASQAEFEARFNEIAFGGGCLRLPPATQRSAPILSSIGVNHTALGRCMSKAIASMQDCVDPLSEGGDWTDGYDRVDPASGTPAAEAEENCRTSHSDCQTYEDPQTGERWIVERDEQGEITGATFLPSAEDEAAVEVRPGGPPEISQAQREIVAEGLRIAGKMLTFDISVSFGRTFGVKMDLSKMGEGFADCVANTTICDDLFFPNRDSQQQCPSLPIADAHVIDPADGQQVSGEDAIRACLCSALPQFELPAVLGGGTVTSPNAAFHFCGQAERRLAISCATFPLAPDDRPRPECVDYYQQIGISRVRIAEICTLIQCPAARLSGASVGISPVAEWAGSTLSCQCTIQTSPGSTKNPSARDWCHITDCGPDARPVLANGQCICRPIDSGPGTPGPGGGPGPRPQ